MKIKAAVLYKLGGRLEVEDIELTDQLRLRRPGTGHSLRDYPRCHFFQINNTRRRGSVLFPP